MLRAHDHRDSPGDGCVLAFASILPPDREHVIRGGGMAVVDFVPAYHRLAVLLGQAAHLSGEVVLEFPYLLHPFLAVECHAPWAFFPDVRRHFVAPEMYVVRGEYLDERVNDIFYEFVGLRIADAHHVFIHALALLDRPLLGIWLKCPSLARQLGHGSEQCRAVSRQVYLGDHVDATLGGVGYNLPYVILGVVFARHFREVGIGRPHRRQPRVVIHGETPRLVVCQMEVQRVEFEECHLVQRLLQLIDGPEVSRAVQHQSAIGKARRVVHRQGRQPRAIAGEDELLQRGERMVETAQVGRAYLHPVAVDCQAVALGCCPLLPSHGDVAAVPGRLQRDACQCRDVLGEVGRDPRPFVGDADCLDVGQRERTVVDCHLPGLWDDVHALHELALARCQRECRQRQGGQLSVMSHVLSSLVYNVW